MQKIIHVDMDCFYAAVEQRDFPELKGKPVAVGGKKEHRGVISTCNYEARKFGIHSAMSSAYALKLCPDLILMPGRMAVYKSVSQQIRQIFLRYTELIEPLSLDEAYLDVSHSNLYRGSATFIAKAIRQDIYTETKLTASAGIAPIKFLAKVASDLNKPNGQFVITPSELAEFVTRLPLNKIPGVGKVTSAKLAELGLHTCLDVQKAPKSLLLERFGKFGKLLIERSYGIDSRQVLPNRVRKSVGIEMTLDNNIYSLAQAEQILAGLIPELKYRIAKSAQGRNINKQVVKLKFADFKQTTIEQRSDHVSDGLFYQLLVQAMLRANDRSIRLVGISVGLIDPKNKEPENNQLALFTD